MYVDVNEIMKDWGCSRAKGYQIIEDLNAQLLKMNPTPYLYKASVTESGI